MNIFERIIVRIGHQFEENQRKRDLNQLLSIAKFDKITQPKLTKVDTIAIVMPLIAFTSGGGSSILRIGNYLCKKGAQVSFIAYNSDDVQQMEEIAKKAIKDFQGHYITFDDAKSRNFDVIIATDWKSVYYARLLEGYKFYFMQDFEPYFNPVNDEYILAKKTYDFGFHVISLGNWNAAQLKNICNITDNVDVIDFPYEPSEYSLVKRDFSEYTKKKDFKIAVYIRNSGRRLPFIIQILLKKTCEELKTYGYNFEVYFYGIQKYVEVMFGHNLGYLTKQELHDLYLKVDFGMVASVTNISLVPYEMIASGLPLIEFEDGSYQYFLGDDTAILTDLDSHHLALQIKDLIENSDKLRRMQDKAYSKIDGLTWEKTCEQFWQVLQNTVR